MIIIMLGAPGSGKGTIGKKLCDEYSLEHVATGDIFRDEIKRGTECGIKANEFISQGKLVPDEITIEMVLNKLKKSKNVCLDGFPRTINQAEKLDEFLNNNNDKVTAVINLSVPDEDLIKGHLVELYVLINHVVLHIIQFSYHLKWKEFVMYVEQN